LSAVSKPEYFSEINELIKQINLSMEEYQHQNPLVIIEKLIPDLRTKLLYLNKRLGSLYFGYS
jgi:hypothetical protein